MIMISNFIYNYFIPGIQGLFMGIGIMVTFEVLKDKAFELYKNHQLKKFQSSLVKARDNKSN